MQKIPDWSLYLITDRKLSGERPLEEIVNEAIQGGITALQIREKHSSTRDFIELGRALHKLTSAAGIPLIINDRVDVAQAIKADGVHLGQEDMPYDAARHILGPKALIGITISNIEEAKAASDWDVAYLGVGPIFHTDTKEKTKEPIGLEGLRSIVSATNHKVVAIGGIKAEAVPSIIESGAAGVAVISAIVASKDPRLAAKEFSEKIKGI